MAEPLVTVAVVPRERFSYSERSLASILDRTQGDFELIYVDGNSPAELSARLARRVAAVRGQWIRRDEYLSPNVARNLAAQQVRTKYVAFIDNDILVTPQWLRQLVNCAEQTAACAVGPLYCQGLPEGATIHMAGGIAQFYEQGGRRMFRESHTLCGQPTELHRAALMRGPVELLEYHCLLLRMDAFDRFGPLDERYLSLHEHVDLCLQLRAAGLGVVMEPASMITYVGPLPLEPTDYDFFSLRWSAAWNQLSIEHFQQKWQIDAADPGLEQVVAWATNHRCQAQTLWQAILRPIGRGRARKLIGACNTWLSRARYSRSACERGGPWSGGRLIAALPSRLAAPQQRRAA